MVADAKGRAYAALRRRVPGAYLVRIENAAGVGLPDVYGAYRGTSFWIELKVGRWARAHDLRNGPLLVTESRPQYGPLRPEQIAVLTQLTAQGVLAFVAFYQKPRLKAYKFCPHTGIAFLETRLPGERDGQ